MVLLWKGYIKYQAWNSTDIVFCAEVKFFYQPIKISLKDNAIEVTLTWPGILEIGDFNSLLCSLSVSCLPWPLLFCTLCSVTCWVWANHLYRLPVLNILKMNGFNWCRYGIEISSLHQRTWNFHGLFPVMVWCKIPDRCQFPHSRLAWNTIFHWRKVLGAYSGKNVIPLISFWFWLPNSVDPQGGLMLDMFWHLSKLIYQFWSL